jgi:hypothetical protein
MASSTASVGGLAVITPGSQRLVVLSVLGVPSAGGTPQGTSSVEVVGAGPWLDDDTGSLLWGLVVRISGAGVFESPVMGDAAPALGP